MNYLKLCAWGTGLALLLAFYWEMSDAFVPLLAALTASAGAYVIGSALTACGYEIGRWLDAIEREKLGSAHFGTKQEAKEAGLYEDQGVIIGQQGKSWLRFNKPGHLITLSKTRGGKGVSTVVPNLLDHPGSLFCMDIKGENYAITARRRRDFGPVLPLSPFGRASARYNPLDFIRIGKDEIDDASLIATLIVVPVDKEDSFWEREARTLITGLILYVVRHRPPAQRTLSEVRHLLTLGPGDFADAMDDMMGSPHWWIRRAASAFMQKSEKERSGVISTAQSHTKVFDSPRLAKVNETSDFQLEELKQGVASVYLIIPPHQVPVYRPYLRLMVGLATAAMTRSPTRPKTPVLFMLDEFPSLGRMPSDGFSYLAGYGARLWVITQSLEHMEAIYGKRAQAIVANCAVVQAWSLSPTDYVTAEALSKVLGEQSINVRNVTRSSKFRFWPRFHSYSHSDAPRTRRLLGPDEILCLPECAQLLFVSGSRPFLTERVIYYRDSRFRGLFENWQPPSLCEFDARHKIASRWKEPATADVLPDIADKAGR